VVVIVAAAHLRGDISPLAIRVGSAAASSLSPNEKRGAEEYATTSMSILMATMARSMPQFGLLYWS
jgi:hypothetical protein